MPKGTEVGERLATGLKPVPLSETCCGLVGSEFVTRKVAVRVPPAVGVKVTLIVQLAPAAKVEPQVVVRAKSPAFVPVKEVTIEVRLVVPMLLRVTTWAELVVPATWLPKVRLPGARVTPVPVPVRATVCGLPEALSVMESEAVREPIALGLNVMLKVQLSPTARVAPQVVVRVKSAALVPVTLVLLMVILAVPVLVSVTVLALLVVLSP